MPFELTNFIDKIPIPDRAKTMIKSPIDRLKSTKVLAYTSNVITRHFSPESFLLSDLTPYQIIVRSGLMSVRYYPPLQEQEIVVNGASIPVVGEQHGIPIILVPPLGVSAWIFDLLEERSLVKYLMAHGYSVYLVDWGEPDRSHAHLSLETYVLDWLPEAVSAVKAFAYGESKLKRERKVSMMGYCMGGLLTLMYAASSKDSDVENVVTVASPIDFHASGPHGRVMKILSRPLNDIARVTRFSLSHLNPMMFHTSGEKLSWMFKMTNPLSNVTSYLDLLVNMADRDYVATHMTMSRWFNEMLDYPGATTQSVLAKMWLDNQMAKGYVSLGVDKFKLSGIRSNFLCLAGTNDRIVGIRAARRAMDVVASKDKTFEVVPGGHAGVFAGAKAPANTWKSVVNWLDKRSS